MESFDKILKPLNSNKRLKNEMLILFSINSKIKYLDYKLINMIAKNHLNMLLNNIEYKVKEEVDVKQINHKESIDTYFTHGSIKSINSTQSVKSVLTYKNYIIELQDLIKVLESKLQITINIFKKTPSNSNFFDLLNCLTIIQLILITHEGNELVSVFFIHKIIDTIFSLTNKDFLKLISKTNSTWTSFKLLILKYSVNNFLLDEIKYKLVNNNADLYISTFNKFSKNNLISNNYYPKKIYSDLLESLFYFSLDFDSLKTHLAIENTDDYIICKYNNIYYIVKQQLIQSIIRIVFTKHKNILFTPKEEDKDNSITKINNLSSLNQLGIEDYIKKFEYFEYYFIKNLINKFFSSIKSTKGDDYKLIFRDDSLHDELIKAIIFSFDNSFFYSTFIKALSEGGEYFDLIEKGESNFNNSSFFNNISKQSNIDKKVKSTKISKSENKDYINSLSVKLMIKPEVKIEQEDSKDSYSLNLKHFLEFYSDFCNNLLNKMPYSLRIILRIVYDEAIGIFTIPDKNTLYPIFILLFFKFYCSPQFHSLYNFPSNLCCKKKLLQLTKLFINITSNTLFNTNDKTMNQFNEVILDCNNKLTKIFQVYILNLDEMQIKKHSIEVFRIINCPVNMFYNDCEFTLFCLEDYTSTTMTYDG